MTPIVVIYTSSRCPYSRELCEYLQARQLPYQELNVERSDEHARAAINLAGQSLVPVTAIWQSGVAPTVVVGFDRPKLDSILEVL